MIEKTDYVKLRAASKRINKVVKLNRIKPIIRHTRKKGAIGSINWGN